MISTSSHKKILLILLPYWTPLIPPLGISCLKGFLQPYDFDVTTVDANVEIQFTQLYDRYFDTLKADIPRERRGNFFNIGIDVLQNHMTAFQHHQDEKEYLELVKTLIYKTFFYQVNESRIHTLNQIIAEFYQELGNYLHHLLERKTPDILGISVYKGTFAPSLFAFRQAKKNYPDIMTVMGGGIFFDQLALGSPNFEFFLQKTPYIDKIIVGEGELLFLKLLTGELSPSQRVYNQETLNGQSLDISAAEVPDFSDFDPGYYSFLAAYTSRSCPFQCGFCAETVNWGKYRKKTPHQVVSELIQLYETYGSQLFMMCDSLLNPIAADLAKELFNSDISLYWDGYLRVDEQTREIENPFLWRRGGFYRARMGIESGSARVLKLMNKRITPGQISASLVNLAHVGIKTSTYWVIGYPGETEEDFLETLSLIEELKDHIYEAEANPFRFYLSGQVKSGEWAAKNKSMLLYPGSAAHMLILQTWILQDVEPSREEIYSRLSRFVAHCKKWGVPNPYTWQEINHADERWKKLHPNAVPSLMEFKSCSYIGECKSVENLLMLQNAPLDEGDFDFL